MNVTRKVQYNMGKYFRDDYNNESMATSQMNVYICCPVIVPCSLSELIYFILVLILFLFLLGLLQCFLFYFITFRLLSQQS